MQLLLSLTFALFSTSFTFYFINLLQLRWPIRSNCSQICYFMHMFGIHQGRTLVFDKVFSAFKAHVRLGNIVASVDDTTTANQSKHYAYSRYLFPTHFRHALWINTHSPLCVYRQQIISTAEFPATLKPTIGLIEPSMLSRSRLPVTMGYQLSCDWFPAHFCSADEFLEQQLSRVLLKCSPGLRVSNKLLLNLLFSAKKTLISGSNNFLRFIHPTSWFPLLVVQNNPQEPTNNKLSILNANSNLQ